MSVFCVWLSIADMLAAMLIASGKAFEHGGCENDGVLLAQALTKFLTLQLVSKAALGCPCK